MAQRKLHDQFFKMAKAEGYLARSAYKLKEINERKRLFGPGSRVLDLGCAPGAWVQVALEGIGAKGVVVGIDLKEIRERFPPNAHVMRGDIYKTPAETLLAPAGGKFDCVMSDMAPDTTGHGDHFLSVRLCRRVLELLPALLKAGGSMTMKVFEGEEYGELLNECRSMFGSVKGFKPKASRDVSVEMYIVAHGYRPGNRAGPAERGDGATNRPASDPARTIAPPAARPGWKA
jgi:23S rRNA (uridine2552-2'-O)-methyltransferase